jgi:hypothetical protein
LRKINGQLPRPPRADSDAGEPLRRTLIGINALQLARTRSQTRNPQGGTIGWNSTRAPGERHEEVGASFCSLPDRWPPCTQGERRHMVREETSFLSTADGASSPRYAPSSTRYTSDKRKPVAKISNTLSRPGTDTMPTGAGPQTIEGRRRVGRGRRAGEGWPWRRANKGTRGAALRGMGRTAINAAVRSAPRWRGR